MRNRGSITDEDRNFTETWENIASHQNAIIRFDTRGDEKHEVIQGKRSFMLTTEERIVTQDRIIDKKLDPFTNGSFRPVVVPETVDIKSNPNALSDEEIIRVFQSSDLAWEEYMKVIDSPDTLRRMVDLADQADVSLKRYKQVATKLSVVKPPTRIVQKDQELYDNMDNPRSRSSERAARRGQGGRSADYR